MREHIVIAGDILRVVGNDYNTAVYMYAQVSPDNHTLINLYNGNRYTDKYFTSSSIPLSKLADRTKETWEYVGRFSRE